LSLGFPRLTRPWRIVAIGVSLGASISYIVGAMQGTAATVPRYPVLEPTDYVHLAIVLALYWGFALILPLCSYLLWRQVRASNNLSRRP
jgi:Sec-independent protein secretion pathway component TatC